MPEFDTGTSKRKRLRRFFLRPGLTAMSFLVVVVALLSGPSAERLGDRFQNALPLFAWGCAIAGGEGIRYAGRFVLLEVFIHVPKSVLGQRAINMRPNGKDHGFPSGHTAAAAFGATALAQGCLSGNPAAQAVAIIAAGFTGASRIASNNHTIWQVLAGAVLGFLMNHLTLTVFDAVFRRIVLRAGRFIGIGTAVGLALTVLPTPRAEAARWSGERAGFVADVSHTQKYDGEWPFAATGIPVQKFTGGAPSASVMAGIEREFGAGRTSDGLK